MPSPLPSPLPTSPLPSPLPTFPGSPEAFDIRVRPALDSPGAAIDRIKMVGATCC